MSVKSVLFKSALALGGAYLAYKGYQFGKAIYLEAKEELDKQNAADGKKPLEKVIGEAVSDTGAALRDAGRVVRDNAHTVIDAASESDGTLSGVIKDAATHVAVQALNEVAEPPLAASLDGEGGAAAPRPAAAAPESQEAAGGASQAADPSAGTDGSQLPPVKG